MYWTTLFKCVNFSCGAYKSCCMYEIHQISLINKFCFLHFSGMKNVALFFSATATQHLKKQRGKQKPNKDRKGSDNTEECEEVSQLAGSSSQDWLANHVSIINEKMCPSVSYWNTLTTLNGAPTSLLAIHHALLECRMDVFTNQVRKRKCEHFYYIGTPNTQHS